MTSDDIFHVLLKTDPFEQLEPDVLWDLVTAISFNTYFPNTYVFKQGDISLDCLFVIVSGLVDITVTSDRGVEMVVSLRRQFDFFGETVVLSRGRYPAGARVRENLLCLRIPRSALEPLIYRYPEFSGFFNALLTERIRLLYEKIVSEYSLESYSGLELSLFQKRVSDVMSYPVITCQLDDTVSAAARLMSDKDISAIVVMDQENKPRGILTEKYLVKYLIADLMYPIEQCRVEHVLNSNLVEINPEAFIGQALVTMIRRKTKNLIVMERGNLVGIINIIDLLKSRSTGTMLLTHNIETQPNSQCLAFIGSEVDNILNTLVTEKATVTEILEVASELHERMGRRVVQLAEERMKLDGWGAPPVEYCWLNMGSAARYEQTLRTDQDNAIIYQDPSPDKTVETEAYFARLANFVVQGLAECGFQQCAAGIMPINSRWRRSLKSWLAAVNEGLQTCSIEPLRMATMLLDARPVWGNLALAETFRRTILDLYRQKLHETPQLAQTNPRSHLSLTFLGTFITETIGGNKNWMNLKKAGLVHLVNSVRIMAVSHGITEQSTLGRIEHLVQLNAISSADSKVYRESFEALLLFQIRENLKKVRQGVSPDNYIDPYSLRKRERQAIKDALVGVSSAQQYVQEKFGAFWLNLWTQDNGLNHQPAS